MRNVKPYVLPVVLLLLFVGSFALATLLFRAEPEDGFAPRFRTPGPSVSSDSTAEDQPTEGLSPLPTELCTDQNKALPACLDPE